LYHRAEASIGIPGNEIKTLSNPSALSYAASTGCLRLPSAPRLLSRQPERIGISDVIRPAGEGRCASH